MKTLSQQSIPRRWKAGTARFSTLRRPAGFSLVELLIAVAIAAFGILSTLSLLIFDQAQNDQEQQRARAHQIVCEEMERVRHELFSRVTSGTEVTVWDNGTPDDATDDTQGTMEVVISDPATGAELTAAPVPAVIVRAEVTLTWNPAGRMSGKTLRETAMTCLVP